MRSGAAGPQVHAMMQALLRSETADDTSFQSAFRDPFFWPEEVKILGLGREASLLSVPALASE